MVTTRLYTPGFLLSGVKNLLTDLGKQAHEFTALQKGERMHLFFLKQAEQNLPVRVPKAYQFAQGLMLLRGKMHGTLLTV